ncbi:MAG: sodium:calcium antiporter [Gammaproteobacteria bacterium]|nr:sodium:calcium antiporter [Gammaproteobacteria bacterium]
MTFLLLLGSLLLILISAEAFTNGLEHVGARFKISEGVTGSVFAAVGTAMPEAMVPIVAVLSTAATQDVREQVGVGAILGAPLMLSTVAMLLMGLFAAFRRGWAGHFHPEHSGLRRDLTWFVAVFSLSAATIFVPHEMRLTRAAIALSLIGLYLFYLLLTVRASAKLVADGHGTEAGQPLLLLRAFGRTGAPSSLPVELLQLLLGLAGIVGGAHGFVRGVENLSATLGITALTLSLLIIPLATELPEKVNSVLWIRRGKDTLAFGNVTGAMVFQGSLLPALGIFLTPWEARPEVLAVLVLTLCASLWLLLMTARGTLRPYHMLFNGACYVAYIVTVLI